MKDTELNGLIELALEAGVVTGCAQDKSRYWQSRFYEHLDKFVHEIRPEHPEVANSDKCQWLCKILMGSKDEFCGEEARYAVRELAALLADEWVGKKMVWLEKELEGEIGELAEDVKNGSLFGKKV